MHGSGTAAAAQQCFDLAERCTCRSGSVAAIKDTARPAGIDWALLAARRASGVRCFTAALPETAAIGAQWAAPLPNMSPRCAAQSGSERIRSTNEWRSRQSNASAQLTAS